MIREYLHWLRGDPNEARANVAIGKVRVLAIAFSVAMIISSMIFSVFGLTGQIPIFFYSVATTIFIFVILHAMVTAYRER